MTEYSKTILSALPELDVQNSVAEGVVALIQKRSENARAFTTDLDFEDFSERDYSEMKHRGSYSFTVCAGW
jgi:hypothetical protein